MATIADAEIIAEIHTSDRASFKRCRRRWSWNSPLRGGRRPASNAVPLWLGTGFHFALEDYHGYNQYGSPDIAFAAYAYAQRRTKSASVNIPDEWGAATLQAMSMLRYYPEWLSQRNQYKTFWYEDKPQVEVSWAIDISDFVIPSKGCTLREWAALFGYTKVIYAGTFDRVVIDEHNRLWVWELKTAARMRVLHFMHDLQVTMYAWAAEFVYPNYEIAGVLYQQHAKGPVSDPLLLKDLTLSVNKQQAVSTVTYTKALRELYGDAWPTRAPQKNLDFLTWLSTQEGDDYDCAIRRDKIYRNQEQLQASLEHAIEETAEIIDQNLPLYPNQTRDCEWDCPFVSACVSKDDGSDYEAELADIYGIDVATLTSATATTTTNDFDTSGASTWRMKLPNSSPENWYPQVLEEVQRAEGSLPQSKEQPEQGQEWLP